MRFFESLTLVQIQSLIVCAVFLVTALVIGSVIIHEEKREEAERLERIRKRYQ